MRFRPIVGTLAYLLDRTTDRVLLISRDARPDDDHYGKVNGLGGKLEEDESAVGGIRREIREEAGLELTSLTLRGTITWSNFGPKREQWLAFVFLADGWTGTPPPSNEEGTLLWLPRTELLAACADPVAADEAPALSMWAGDRHFIPLVFDDDPRPFHGTMPYDGDRPLSWRYERL
ncbi:MAG: 8-oxo-dGTP diphosphatase [Actinomycetota bacterium]